MSPLPPHIVEIVKSNAISAIESISEYTNSDACMLAYWANMQDSLDALGMAEDTSEQATELYESLTGWKY